jgi:hypothetical protein
MNKSWPPCFLVAVSLFILASPRLLAQREPERELESVELITGFPVSTFAEGGKTMVFSARDTLTLYFYKQYVLYELRGLSNFSNDAGIKGTETFFVYKRGRKTGLFFSSISHWQNGSTIPVDSFLFTRGKKGRDFEPPPDSSWKLFSRRMQTARVSEWWVPRHEAGENDLDSINLIFDKGYNHIPYSFSAKMDSIYKMKLIKARLIYASKRQATDGKVVPEHEFLFELHHTRCYAPLSVLKFFREYEKSTT